VLVLRRADTASTYPGMWSGISGYLEDDDSLAQAYREIEEETGLGRGDAELRAAARPLRVTGPDARRWLVYPFLFSCLRPETVRLNEENAAAEWVDPQALSERPTVPALEEAYVHAKLAERVERIAKDDKHGASWLAKEAVEAVVEAVEVGADVIQLARELVQARPAMGAIAGALGRVLAAGRTPEQIVEEARALVAARERASAAIAVLLVPFVEGVVMTHSASATVREALMHTPPDRVVCTVSEPVGEGRELEGELRDAGFATELVPDEDAAHAVRTVNLLLVGADTVYRDGSLVNKIGTAGLAQAAKDAGVPVVVACEVIKLAPVDSRDPGEERFDLTPPELVDTFVTEEGAFTPEDIASLIDRTPFLRVGYELLAPAAERNGS
jgi:translation initiation factor 2B subunit (eIF-2B alpha/beta/delta family)/8-oxo-dGTP pyrophosphatase MutT (NUDIX family)